MDKSIDIPNATEKKYKQATGMGPLSGIFNFCVLMLGTSLVAAAYSFSLTTSFLGIITVLILAIWSWFSALCLYQSGVAKKASSLNNLARQCFGQKGYKQIYTFVFIAIPIFITNFGGLAAYTTVASSSIAAYVDLDILYIQLICIVVIAILGTLNSYNKVKYVAYITLFVFVVVIVSHIGTTSYMYGHIERTEQRSFVLGDYIQAIPILALGLNGHPALPGMAGEMRTSAQKKFPLYLGVAIFFIACINCTVAFLPSYLMGECTQSNSLVQMACSYQTIIGSVNIPLLIANLCLSVAIIIQCPIILMFGKEMLLDYGDKAVRDVPLIWNFLISLGIASVAGVLAILLGNITNTLNTVATLGALTIMGPGAGLCSLFSEPYSFFARFRAYTIIITGGIFLIINFYTIVMTFAFGGTTIENQNECLCAQ